MRLSRLASLLSPSTPTSTPAKYGLLGFDPFSTLATPSKVLVTGGGSANPALISVLGTILGAEVVGMAELVPASDEGEPGGTTSSALGAAKKARWTWATTRTPEGAISFEEFEDQVRLKRQGVFGEGGGGPSAESEWLSTVLTGVRLGTDGPGNGEVGPRAELVSLASPDKQLFEYYGTMLHEFERLSIGVRKGLV